MTARSSWSPRLCGSHHHAAPPRALPMHSHARSAHSECAEQRGVSHVPAPARQHTAQVCWSPIKLSRKRVGQCVHGRAGAKVLACMHRMHSTTDDTSCRYTCGQLRAKRSNRQGRHSSIYVHARVRVRTRCAFLPVCHRIRVYETCGANAPYACHMV